MIIQLLQICLATIMCSKNLILSQWLFYCQLIALKYEREGDRKERFATILSLKTLNGRKRIFDITIHVEFTIFQSLFIIHNA